MTLTRPTQGARLAAHVRGRGRGDTSTTSSATCSISRANRETADDLAASTFEKAFRQWHRFDAPRGTARAWLLGMARTTALDWFRGEKRRRRREEAAAEPEAHEEAFVEGLSPALQAALAELSAGEREVIALRIVLELDGDADSARARDQHDRRLDPAQPGPGQARGEDEGR